MKNIPANILMVDDDLINLEILEEYLEDYPHYKLYCFDNAQDALELMYNEPFLIDVALVDLMMPTIDGVELTDRMKKHPILYYIPIIMQTASNVEEDLIRSINAGIFYYITKPYKRSILISLIYSALQERQLYINLNSEIESAKDVLSMLTHGEFKCRTLDESHRIASSLAKLYPHPEKVLRGISELLINAIEHGNLNISYDEKTQLNEEGIWLEEIKRRLDLEEHVDKFVEIEFKKDDEKIELIVKDQGKGFDWYNFLELKPERAFENHGRGIAFAKMTSFDELEYLNKGNIVKTLVYIHKKTTRY